MAGLKLQHIYKVYPNGVKAVSDFSLDIQNNEFIVFVGPSGCGKSTTLRMIAGLEEITAGDLYIDDVLVNNLEPKDRDIAFVFQNYALYPHMTVYENMAFGLKNRKYPQEEINKRVLEAAKILDIEQYLDRKPKEMSGGQRQRVALGRSIVRNPKVFLLDEPLSNLDAKLRAQMRTEITRLHKKIGTTFIYVTHDQVEAMTMGTRIVVMKDGFIQQIDTPMNLYHHPVNKFVAGFIGTPQMNFFESTLKQNGEKVLITIDNKNQFEVPYDLLSKIDSKYFDGTKPLIMGCRAEHISIAKKGIPCKINVIEALGNESILYANPDTETEGSIVDSKQIVIKITDEQNYHVDDIIYIEFNPAHLHFFDKENEKSLLNILPEFNRVRAKIQNNSRTLFGKEFSLPEAISLADDDYDFLIPANAITPGNQFSLKVRKCESVEDFYLLTLENNKTHLFAISDSEIKEGSLYSFDIRPDKISIAKENEIIQNPIDEIYQISGKLVKEKISKKEEQYSYDFGGNHKVAAPFEKVKKLASTEGKACLTKEYSFHFNAAAIHLFEKEFEFPVNQILNYGKAKYAEINFSNQIMLIKVPQDFKQSMLSFALDSNELDIYSVEHRMRIC